jgi:hypothetical protein
LGHYCLAWDIVFSDDFYFIPFEPVDWTTELDDESVRHALLPSNIIGNFPNKKLSCQKLNIRVSASKYCVCIVYREETSFPSYVDYFLKRVSAFHNCTSTLSVASHPFCFGCSTLSCCVGYKNVKALA